MLIVRIFCELHAKMEPESQCLYGFQEDTVEMTEARYRALTHFFLLRSAFLISVEMTEARYRALTHLFR